MVDSEAPTEAGFVTIESGEFQMGSDRYYEDERPVRRDTVKSFEISPTQVTNSEFAKFVEATDFVTEAEKPPNPALYPGASEDDLVPGGLVFAMSDGPVPLDNYFNWWRWVPGADWRHPTGPDSDLVGLGDHPVVQVCHGDAIAYCEWAGVEIPTEEEWEYAARGGIDGADFTWGSDDPQETEPVANTWQGSFPYENTEVDGYTRTSPVGSYPTNGFGLYDMAGNVWEWTDSWYTTTPVGPSCCAPSVGPQDSYDPNEPVKIPRKAVKGGSHLCTPQYCYRYRPAARQPQTIETATSHIGFRVIRRG